MNKFRNILAKALNRPLFLTFELIAAVSVVIGLLFYYPSNGIVSSQSLFFLWAFPILLMILSLNWAARAYMNIDLLGLLGLTIGSFFAIWLSTVLIYTKTGIYLYSVGSAFGVIIVAIVFAIHYGLWLNWDQRKLNKIS